MQVYHTGRIKHANDLSGKGAELHGGRWNSIGVPCIYASASRALSVLEYAANVKLTDLPHMLGITTYEIPENCWHTIDLAHLPHNWQQRPYPKETAELGSLFLSRKQFLAIKVPSVIVAQEYNFLLNPLHPSFGQVKIVEVSSLVFDGRIKQ